MKTPQQSEDASESKRSKLISRPRRYVDVNDLRSMLRLGLGLHTIGHPNKRLNKALDGLARLAGADGWVAMVVELGRKGEARVIVSLVGGKDAQNAKTVGERISAEVMRSGSSVRKLVGAPGQTRGRVLALIREGPDDSAVHSVLRSEESRARETRITWISIHRLAGAFGERERRMVELFHSQSAWLLMKMAE